MKNLPGTRTEQNLIRLFALESQDRNRYSYFSSQAKKEGYVQIAAISEETANQEKEHAKRLFKFFQGGNVECSSSFSAAGAAGTLENLKFAVAQKAVSHASIYPEVARQARANGFLDVALVVEALALAEPYQGRRFQALAANLEAGQAFRRNEDVTWRCLIAATSVKSRKLPSAASPAPTPRLILRCWAKYFNRELRTVLLTLRSRAAGQSSWSGPESGLWRQGHLTGMVV